MIMFAAQVRSWFLVGARRRRAPTMAHARPRHGVPMVAESLADIVVSLSSIRAPRSSLRRKRQPAGQSRANRPTGRFAADGGGRGGCGAADAGEPGGEHGAGAGAHPRRHQRRARSRCREGACAERSGEPPARVLLALRLIARLAPTPSLSSPAADRAGLLTKTARAQATDALAEKGRPFLCSCHPHYSGKRGRTHRAEDRCFFVISLAIVLVDRLTATYEAGG